MRLATLFSYSLTLVLLLVGSGWLTPAQAQPTGVTAYGGSIDGLEVTLISFDLGTPGDVTPVAENPDLTFAGVVEVNGESVYLISGTTLSRQNLNTGELTGLGDLAPASGQGFFGLTYDTTTETYYGLTTDGSTSFLYSIDVETVTATEIGEVTNLGAAFGGLAAGPDGTLYTYDVNADVLLSVDEATAEGTVIGPIGFDAQFTDQSMEFDPETGMMYMAANNVETDQAELRTVDLATGSTTLVGALDASQLTWLGTPIMMDSGGPPNDDIADAILIDEAGTYTGANVGATAEENEPVPNIACSGGGAVTSVYWTFTPDEDDTVTIDAGGSNFDTVLSLLRADDLTEVACDDDGGDGTTSVIEDAPVTAGTTYLVRIAGFGAAESGDIVFDVSFGSQTGPPPNDDIANAAPIDGAGTYTGSNINATAEESEPLPSCTAGGQVTSVYWTFTPEEGQIVTIDTGGSTFDTVLSLLRADDLTEVACDDDGGEGTTSLIVGAPVTAGATYFVRIAGFGATQVGDITFDITFETVTAPPNDDIANATPIDGDGTYTGANFLATAEAGEPLPSCTSGGTVTSVYWTFTPGQDGGVRVDARGSTFDLTLTLLEAADLSELACDDIATGGNAVLDDVPVTAGTTYLVRIAGSEDSGAGTISFDFTLGAAPDLTGVTAYAGLFEDDIGIFELVSFDLGAPGNITFEADSPGFSLGGAFDVDGESIYLISALPTVLWRQNVNTGELTELGELTPASEQSVQDMTYDASTETYYALTTDGGTTFLYTVDVEAVTTTEVGQVTNIQNGIGGLAAGPDGTLYTYDVVADVLLSVDKATAEGTVIGPLGFDADDQRGQGMAFDPETATMYMTAYSEETEQPEFRTVDLDTGNTELVGPLDGTQYVWLAFPVMPIVANEDGTTPTTFALEQNYPNPFAGQTTIAYALPEAAPVTLTVYDVMGRHVATLLDEEDRPAGTHEVAWDARGLASGVYVYRIQAGGYTETHKMILVR